MPRPKKNNKAPVSKSDSKKIEAKDSKKKPFIDGSYSIEFCRNMLNQLLKRAEQKQ